MKTKKAIKYALSLGLLLSLTTPIYAVNEGWQSMNGSWKYTNQDGTFAKGWLKIDGSWYAFNADGSMKTGWVASDEKWYFMGDGGVMQENKWIKQNGFDYYLKGNGLMATDYKKDGFELDATGKAVPMTQTRSVELTEHMDISNKTIEGNLYIDVTKFKDIELTGITVTGKLVILGNNTIASRITLKDASINTISTQARNTEIILSGKTAVDTIQMEENSTVKPDKDYTGKVEMIEIQSTVKNEVKVELAAKSVLSNTFAPISINAEVDNLAINKKTNLKVNANVDTITVNKVASDSIIEVEKDSTVGNIASDTKVEVSGNGTIDKVVGDDIITNLPETEKPSAGAGGGGSAGGGTTGGGNTGGESGAAGGENHPEALQKVKIALEAAKTAVENFKATNETTDEEILEVIKIAIAGEGLICVTPSISGTELTKIVAIVGTAGSIEGQIDIFASPSIGENACDTSAQLTRSLEIDIPIEALVEIPADNNLVE